MTKVAAPEVPGPSVRPRPSDRRPRRVVGGLLFGTALVGVGLRGDSAPKRPEATPVRLAIAPAPPDDPTARSLGDRADAIAEARRLIAGCRDRFSSVKDYTCVFLKQERLECGQQTRSHVMEMKARVEPRSVYFKFRSPRAGREAIYVAGRNGGRALVHDVGLGKLLAGTLRLDPNGSMAMDDCRHPITDAGLGHMIETIGTRWAAELEPGETRVAIDPDATAAGRPTTRIESRHTARRPEFLFNVVRVDIDDELGLPIRFEAYDWPREAGGAPELVERYTFIDLRLDVGLTDRDFDPNNPAYTFGRF